MELQDEVNFLNLRSAHWAGTKSANHLSRIQWKFTKYQGHLSPFPIYQCEMEGWGEKSSGFCFSDDVALSTQKSFAEAWERLWFQKYNKGKNLASSNGFAAGKNTIMAIKNSRQELIERQVLLEAWSSQTGWSPVPNKFKKNKFLALGMKLLGWQTSLYNIQSNIGTIKVGLIRHKKYGAYLDAAFSEDEINSEEKVIFSLLKYVLIFKKNKNYIETTDFSTPEDHLRFYSNPKNLRAFNFLDHLDSLKVVPLNILNSEGIQSEVIVEQSDFPAVAYSYNSSWKKFCWGKLSIQGINPWPQPLA